MTGRLRYDTTVRVNERMRIGELSRRSGVSVRMLRYYESQGLLEPIRTRQGYRDYDAAAEDRVRRIRLLGEAGMILPVIRQLLPCLQGTPPKFQPCDMLRAILGQQLQQLEGRIEVLTRSRSLLSGFLQGL